MDGRDGLRIPGSSKCRHLSVRGLKATGPCAKQHVSNGRGSTLFRRQLRPATYLCVRVLETAHLPGQTRRISCNSCIHCLPFSPLPSFIHSRPPRRHLRYMPNLKPGSDRRRDPAAAAQTEKEKKLGSVAASHTTTPPPPEGIRAISGDRIRSNTHAHTHNANAHARVKSAVAV